MDDVGNQKEEAAHPPPPPPPESTYFHIFFLLEGENKILYVYNILILCFPSPWAGSNPY